MGDDYFWSEFPETLTWIMYKAVVSGQNFKKIVNEKPCNETMQRLANMDDGQVYKYMFLMPPVKREALFELISKVNVREGDLAGEGNNEIVQQIANLFEADENLALVDNLSATVVKIHMPDGSLCEF
jgi:hypothetical protein